MNICSSRHLLIVSSLMAMLAMGCATKPTDAQLATNLKAQMFSDPQTKNADLQVAVKDGVVTLSGTAPSDAARYEAYKIATSTPGVSKVNDQMTVQPPQQTAQATPAPIPAEEPASAPPPKPVREHARRVHKPRPRHTTSQIAANAPAEPSAVTPVSQAPVSTSGPPASSSAASTPSPAPAPQPPPQHETAIFPAGTTVEIQTVDPIDSKTAQPGDEFQATLSQPLTWNNRVVVPKGANVYLRLVASQTSGQYRGQSELQLTLARLEFQGTQYHLQSATYTQVGSSRGKDTAKTVGGGAIVGAIIGAIAGGGKGAVIGGAAGAGAGGVYQGVSKAKQIRIPAETQLDFKLDQPLSISLLATEGAQ